VAKALTVLDAVAEHGRPVRFSELLEDSPYPKATLYRFVQTLTAQGMLSYDPERQTYAPGLRLVRLAHAAWQASSLAPIARPYLDDLSRDTGETVHLAQLDGGRCFMWTSATPPTRSRCIRRPARSAPPIAPAWARRCWPTCPRRSLRLSCNGRPGIRFTPKTITTAEAMRAELAAIRARGHAFDDEEHEPGIICIAVPILARGRAACWARCR
jgi:IclR family KDG regulon transcriptional repressor